VLTGNITTSQSTSNLPQCSGGGINALISFTGLSGACPAQASPTSFLFPAASTSSCEAVGALACPDCLNGGTCDAAASFCSCASSSAGFGWTGLTCVLYEPFLCLLLLLIVIMHQVLVSLLKYV
jgi:hypothetical protein